MQTAVEARRLVGKIVLFLAFCWVVVLIAGLSGAVQGATYKPLNLFLALLPGVAFVPAAYFAVQLHRTSDAERSGRLWRRALILGVVGLVLLVVGAYAL